MRVRSCGFFIWPPRELCARPDANSDRFAVVFGFYRVKPVAVIDIALAIFSIDEFAGFFERVNAAIADILFEFWRIEQVKDELAIIECHFAQNKAVGFEDLHASIR